MMKIKINKLIEILLIFLGTFWIMYFIYNYTLRNRFSYALVPINNTIVLTSLAIILFIRLLPLLSLLNIKVVLDIKMLLDKLCYQLYWKPLNKIFDGVIKIIPGIGDLLMLLSKLIVQLRRITFYYFSIKCYLVMDTIPRTILLITFIIDVYIYNQIYYLIKVIPIVVPYIILMRLLLYILHDFSNHNRADHEKFLDITPLNDGKYHVQFKPHKAYLQDKLNLYCERYFLFKKTYVITDMIMYARDHVINPYFNKITYTMYLLGAIKIFFISAGVFY